MQPTAQAQPSPGAAAADQSLGGSLASAEEEPGLIQPWHLFAFPLESNFSGVRYDEALGAAAERLECPVDGRGASDGGPRWRRGRWAVLLDAAKGCGSRPPDLSKNPVDFVVRAVRHDHAAASCCHLPASRAAYESWRFTCFRSSK